MSTPLCSNCGQALPNDTACWDIFGAPFCPECYARLMPPHPGDDPQLAKARSILAEEKR